MEWGKDAVRDLLHNGVRRPTKTYHEKTYDRIAPSKTKFHAAGKTVLVTGGPTGIGFATAKAFAETGVERIVLTARTSATLEKAKQELEASYPKVKIETFTASITDSERMKEVLTKVGAIDVLVLSAATGHNMTNPTAVTTDEMRNSYETNVISPFDLVKAYYNSPMPKSGSKTIINISSAASQLPMPGQVGYGSTKLAFARVMLHFANEQPDSGVRVFTVHPGTFYTPIVQKLMPEDAMYWEDIDLPAHFFVWLSGPEADFLHGKYVWAHWDVDELLEIKEKITSDPTFLTMGLMQ